MPRRGLTFAVPLALVALAALATGCGGGGADGEATPSASPTVTVEQMTATATLATATATATSTTGGATSTTGGATATPAPDIRQQDLTGQPGLREFLASSGGEVDSGRIFYADLTGDGAEEAVVPVSSGGEGGDIAVFVYGYGPGGLQELLTARAEAGSLRANIVDGALTTTEPVYGPEDPFCCPSQLRTTTYRWDGRNLVVDHQETEPAREN